MSVGSGQGVKREGRTFYYEGNAQEVGSSGNRCEPYLPHLPSPTIPMRMGRLTSCTRFINSYTCHRRTVLAIERAVNGRSSDQSTAQYAVAVSSLYNSGALSTALSARISWRSWGAVCSHFPRRLRSTELGYGRVGGTGITTAIRSLPRRRPPCAEACLRRRCCPPGGYKV